MSKAAIEFLQKYGELSLVSLGCGDFLNRLDNHVKLLVKCGLKYYVGIDRVQRIVFNADGAFTGKEAVEQLLTPNFKGKIKDFSSIIRNFPNTRVEELRNIHCKIVVCQRVLPFRHWENIIATMTPILVLQEDLNGCELQSMDRHLYKKSYSAIVHFGLQPFRTNPLLPFEMNLVLWRRRDYYPYQHNPPSQWQKIRHRFFATCRNL